MSSILQVHVHEGKALYDTNLLSTMDPYVRIRLGKSDKKACTKVINKGGRNVTFDEKLTLTYDNEPELAIWVFDKDTITSDDLIGTAVLSMETVRKEQFSGSLDLKRGRKGKPAGQLRITASILGGPYATAASAKPTTPSSCHSSANSATPSGLSAGHYQPGSAGPHQQQQAAISPVAGQVPQMQHCNQQQLYPNVVAYPPQQQQYGVGAYPQQTPSYQQQQQPYSTPIAAGGYPVMQTPPAAAAAAGGYYNQQQALYYGQTPPMQQQYGAGAYAGGQYGQGGVVAPGYGQQLPQQQSAGGWYGQQQHQPVAMQQQQQYPGYGVGYGYRGGDDEDAAKARDARKRRHIKRTASMDSYSEVESSDSE